MGLTLHALCPLGRAYWSEELTKVDFSLGRKCRKNWGRTGMQPQIIPEAISASLFGVVCKISERMVRGAAAWEGGEDERPECKRDELICLVAFSYDSEAIDRAEDAGEAGAVWITLSRKCEERNLKCGEAYKIPVAKTTEMPSFLLNGMCKDDMQNSGIMNMARSEKTLIMEDAMMSLAMSRHFPGVWGSQILRRGMQCKLLAMVYAE